MDTPIETQETQAPVDELEAFSGDFNIVKEDKDAEGFLVITIDVDGYEVNVQNKETDRDGVIETCVRTAKEVRKNKSAKQ